MTATTTTTTSPETETPTRTATATRTPATGPPADVDLLVLVDNAGSMAQNLAVTGIVGMPPSSRHDCSLSDMTDRDFQCVLDLPEMQEVIDNSAEGRGERLTPSCDDPGMGEAFPPRRLVETIRQIGARGAVAGVSSICELDDRPAFERIVDALRPRLAN